MSILRVNKITALASVVMAFFGSFACGQTDLSAFNQLKSMAANSGAGFDTGSIPQIKFEQKDFSDKVPVPVLKDSPVSDTSVRELTPTEQSLLAKAQVLLNKSSLGMVICNRATNSAASPCGDKAMKAAKIYIMASTTDTDGVAAASAIDPKTHATVVVFQKNFLAEYLTNPEFLAATLGHELTHVPDLTLDDDSQTKTRMASEYAANVAELLLIDEFKKKNPKFSIPADEPIAVLWSVYKWKNGGKKPDMGLQLSKPQGTVEEWIGSCQCNSTGVGVVVCMLPKVYPNLTAVAVGGPHTAEIDRMLKWTITTEKQYRTNTLPKPGSNPTPTPAPHPVPAPPQPAPTPPQPTPHPVPNPLHPQPTPHPTPTPDPPNPPVPDPLPPVTPNWN